ncbi:hypothetical protein AAG570_011462 [Ranatra chinensis]|uniref:Uncharacterized protein n=1 Tax=Ranatra chinensis TaxID=642074 RepID=A0ABD0YKP3_9HEMI
MAPERRNTFYENTKQETTEIEVNSLHIINSEQKEIRYAMVTTMVKREKTTELSAKFEFTPYEWKLITLGLCLPEGCSGSDVKLLGEGMPSIPSPAGHHLHVVRVRPVPGNYSPWTDPTLHVLR